ncbi:hypothetical protein [Brevibacterium sp. JSBI002]|uniref:hypothetical protein n=1 Tax=Brevibacterium sp. JSBI002 TaxID=2886045 RepID=UPI002231D218|nr:hypothetical protein [Brevibacterium sp. JSBI002]UZD63018.1 hypothetical protein LJ362_03985 [Brevibacterium sp. JSBI002]
MLVSFVVTPAAASNQSEVTDEKLTSMQGASPYVEADTEEEAMKKLDKIEQENPGGISAQAASVRFGPCVLYPESFHTRKSSGHKHGGVKPVTVCTKKVTGIKMASQLRYKNALMWVKTGIQVPQAATDKDLKPGEFRYKRKNWVVKFQQTNMEYKCEGTKSHKWSASTIGRLRHQGRTLWARVYASPISAECGPH